MKPAGAIRPNHLWDISKRAIEESQEMRLPGFRSKNFLRAGHRSKHSEPGPIEAMLHMLHGYFKDQFGLHPAHCHSTKVTPATQVVILTSVDPIPNFCQPYAGLKSYVIQNCIVKAAHCIAFPPLVSRGPPVTAKKTTTSNRETLSHGSYLHPFRSYLCTLYEYLYYT